LPNSSKVLGIDNPLAVTRSYRTIPIFVAGRTSGHPGPIMLVRAVRGGAQAVVTGLFGRRAAARGGWLTGLPHRISDLLFAGNDEEAGWRGWGIEERRAGLARVYRDPAFDGWSSARTAGAPGSPWPNPAACRAQAPDG
jgi:hypothetical protein